MKIVKRNCSTSITGRTSKKRYNSIWATIVLTSLVSVSAGLLWVDTATAECEKLSTTNRVELVNARGSNGNTQVSQTRSQNRRTRLPQSVINAVRQDLSRRTGISPGRLRVRNYSQQTWQNGCLGLESSGEICTQVLVSGWRVVISDGRQNWTYRTDNTGRIARLETQTNSVNLSQAVNNAVLQEASRRLNVPRSRLSIESTQQRTWGNGCLGLGGANEACTEALVGGWQVTVRSGEQRLVYRTDNTGSAVRLDLAASNISENSNSALPQPVANTVLRNASEHSGLPNSRLRIESAEQRTWSDGCLGLGGIEELCLQALVPGWQVVVSNGSQRWVYRTNESGSVVRLDGAASSSTSQLSIDN